MVVSLRLTASLVFFASTLYAQGDFDLDKTSPATLGASLDLAFGGAPASTPGLLMMSFSGGPTPIATFDPNDPRSVQVGTEISGAWVFVMTGAGGNGTYSLPLPGTPSLADLVLHWQIALFANGGPTIVGDISNDVVTQTGAAGVGLQAPSLLGTARSLAVGFFDRDNDNGAGDLVVAGGGSGTMTSATGLASTEVWSFRRMEAQSGPNMTTARALHTGVRLDDDRVLLIGGVDAQGNAMTSCELYDPATNTFAVTGSLSTPRALHGAAKMADGRVMVAGGASDLTDATTTLSSTLNSVEIYDPATGSWSTGPSIGGKRLAPALTLLSNGQVMVSGGVQVGFFFGIPVSAVSTTAVQRYNPNTNSWSNGPNMHQGRAGHQFNQVTLGDGRVLMTGGIYVPSLLGAQNATPTNGAELYDPTTNSWMVANMSAARSLHSASLMPSGEVVVCGGAQGTMTTPVSISGVERFDPTTNSWTTLAPLPTPRSAHVAAVLPDGMLLLFGGQGISNSLSSIETLRF